MAGRITYPAKSNNPSDPDTTNKFHYFEADEIKEIINSHADDIESLIAGALPAQSPFYGHFMSLALLQAAYPAGVANAFAVIDTGIGLTKQIAIWNTTSTQWEVSASSEDKVYVASFSLLPSPGLANTLYITNDKTNVYLWNNSQYNLVGGLEFASLANLNIKLPHGGYSGTGKDLKDLIDLINVREIFIAGYWVDTVGNEDANAMEVNNKFRGWPTDDRYVVGKIIALPFDVDDPTKVKLYIDN